MSDTFKVCCCFTRKFNSQVVEPVDEIKKIFENYSDGSGLMDAEQLRRFLVEVQKEEEEEDGVMAAQAIIEGFKEGKHFNNLLFQKKGISLDGFFRYLLSQDNHPMPKKIVHHNMDAPMSHYFMFTGHNSYLTGNQLNSDSSDVPIIKALQKGVRVIELDLWPNSKKDDVIVCHGGTLTTPVELRKCLRSIKDHAFDTSQYPVVITLEDHLNADLQATVAQMVTETFGDMLFYPKSGSLEVLPSPESLKGRVMLSTKPPKEYLVAKVSQEDISERDKDPDEDTWGKEVPDLKAIEYAQHDESVSVDHHPSGDNMGDDDDDDDEKLARLNSEKVPPPEYKRLITIRAGKQKGGIKEWLKVEPNKVRRLSLSEQEVGKAVHSHATDIIRFTQHNILRIYPMGIRFDSSNYNPMMGWIHGAQMVALNMQGYGRSIWVMHGLFKANGGCGYVKKSDFLLKTGQNNEVFDPRFKLPVKKTLVVRVYMGDGWHLDFKKTHFDKFSPPDFYTRVGIAGVPDDTIMMKTKIIEDDWSPVWDEEFRFPLTVPELAVLRIEVHEYDV